MNSFNAKLLAVARRDPRYAYEAYEFIFQALDHTQKMLGRASSEGEPADANEPHHHVTGRQLMEGARDYAVQEFGLMARVVFRMWGIHRTDDFGAIVFNLIEAELMSKTAADSLDDFHEVFDLDEALCSGFRIVLEEE